LTHTLRTSERSDFNVCPQRWWWRWREGLVTRGSSPQALWFGGLVHVALAEWYCGPGLKRGPHPAETFAKLAGDELEYVKTQFDTDDEERIVKYENARYLGVAMLTGYVEKYGRDEHMFILQPEKTFALDIPWPRQEEGRQALYEDVDGQLLVRYVGTYDCTWRDLRDDSVRLEEHKTAKAITTTHLPMDNQAGSYWAVATRTLRADSLIGPKETLAGIEYNFLRKALPDDRPRDEQGYACNKPVKADYIAAINAKAGDEFFSINPKLSLPALEAEALKLGLTVLGERSKVQPPALFERHMIHRTKPEQATQLKRIQDEAIHMRSLRDGLLPITLAPSRDHCSFCSFKAMCELKERGGNWQDFKRLQYRAEDPYAAHRDIAD
jgi:hypothetical protein